MSDNNILKRFSNRNPAEGVSPPAEPEGEEIENLSSFGYFRGMRDRAISLELRKKSGHIMAVNYSFITRFEFEPAIGIILHIGGQKLTIKGRNLNTEMRPNVRLFEGLTRFRVPWIQEAERAELLRTSELGAVVERIEW